MSNILQVAYTCEGSTDERFLGHIIEKTIEGLLFESNMETEIYPPVHVDEEGDTFKDKIMKTAKKFSYFHLICVHCDSDSPDENVVMRSKIEPAFELVANTVGCCENLVALIPVQMSESWMLSDIDLLLAEINTDQSANELNLPSRVRNVEGISDPKERIENALARVQSNISRRRKKLKISDLYSPISQKLQIEKLERLPSFRLFQDRIKEALTSLNYLN